MRTAQISSCRSSAKLAPSAALALLVTVIGQGCGARGAQSPEVLGAHLQSTALDFAYELAQNCRLESLPGALDPSSPVGWKALAPQELATSRVDVIDKRTYSEPAALVRALLVRDSSGATRWIRNTPAASPAEVATRWSCAVDAALVGRVAKPLVAEHVRLVPSAPTCAGLTALLGRASDVTFEPYTVAGRRLFTTPSGPALGVTLVGPEGEEAVTVLGSDFDACFAVTSRAPMPPADRKALLDWLADPSKPAPNVPLASYRQAVGLEDSNCIGEGDGATRHEECRAGVFAVTEQTGAAVGARLSLHRERITDAAHGYGGRLAPAQDLVGINAVVRHVRSQSEGFADAFASALSASLLNAPEQQARASSGYRLLRTQDASPPVVANVHLDVDVSYASPKAETVEAGRRQRTVEVVRSRNPDLILAGRRIEFARSALAQAEGEAPAYAQLFARPLPACSAGAPASCDVAAKGALAARVEKRRQGVVRLEAAARELPETTEQTRVVETSTAGKATRRAGEATVTIKLTPTDALVRAAPLSVTQKVAFEAIEPDATAGAATAKAPERKPVPDAAARAVLRHVDDFMSTWLRRSTLNVPVGVFERGSRERLALLARHAASGRRVHAMSYLVESRPEIGNGFVDYPISIPASSPGAPATPRCFVFAAIPVRAGVGADADIVVRNRTTQAFAARDVRSTSGDASVELCGAPAGPYTLQVRSTSAPVAVGMFESTPGLAEASDYGEVAGPTAPAKVGPPPAARPPTSR